MSNVQRQELKSAKAKNVCLKLVLQENQNPFPEPNALQKRMELYPKSKVEKESRGIDEEQTRCESASIKNSDSYRLPPGGAMTQNKVKTK